MSVRLTWRIQRINELDLPAETKNKLIEGLIAKRAERIRLFAVDVSEGVAAKAFTSKKKALAEWLKTHGVSAILAEGALPESIKVHTWLADINDFLKHTKNGETTGLDAVNEHSVLTVPLGHGYSDDIKNSLKHNKP